MKNMVRVARQSHKIIFQVELDQADWAFILSDFREVDFLDNGFSEFAGKRNFLILVILLILLILLILSRSLPAHEIQISLESNILCYSLACVLNETTNVAFLVVLIIGRNYQIPTIIVIR